MLAKARKIQLTTEELDTLLNGTTDNGKVDTIPEIIDYIDRGTSPSDMQPLSNLEIESILN